MLEGLAGMSQTSQVIQDTAILDRAQLKAWVEACASDCARANSTDSGVLMRANTQERC